MTYSSHFNQNRLLKLLEAAGAVSFLSKLQLVHLDQGEVIFESGHTLTYSYFPITADISTWFKSSETIQLEMEAIRCDGMFGLLPMIDNETVTKATVQNAGYAYRIETKQFEIEIGRSSTLMQVLLKYLQLRMIKIAQMSVCSRFHTIQQQMCRVLLNSLDCSPSDTLNVTQRTLAAKLNVRRESITFCSSEMQRQGIIEVKRGKVTVLNRKALENLTCECYQVIVSETEHLLNASQSKVMPNTVPNYNTVQDLEYRFAY